MALSSSFTAKLRDCGIDFGTSVFFGGPSAFVLMGCMRRGLEGLGV